VVLDRSAGNVENFFTKNFTKPLCREEKIKILKLLEIQRHAMLMYTSCGWFFDDLWGIETTQIIQYAARAIQLAKDIFTVDLEPEFLERFVKATSNVVDLKDSQAVYAKRIKPSVIDHLDVAAHYAINHLFEEYPEVASIYSFSVTRRELREYVVGRQRLLLGWAEVHSNITMESYCVDFMVLHVGEYSFSAAVRMHHGMEAFSVMEQQIKDVFLKNRIPDAVRLMAHLFERHHYSLWNLFKNEQRKVLSHIFNTTVKSVDQEFRQIYKQFHPLLEIKQDSRFPLPKALAMIVEFTLNSDIIEVLKEDPIDFPRLTELVKELKRWAFTRDQDNLSYVASRRLTQLMQKIEQAPDDWQLLVTMQNILKILSALPLSLDLWKVQNIYFNLAKTTYPPQHKKMEQGDVAAKAWIQYFDEVGLSLKVHIPKGALVVEAR
jgi:hypothetical protein